jgi:integrase
MGLTDKFLKNIRVQSERYEVADTNGLSIRVSPNGKITFQTRFRFDGKAHRIDYGSYPEISLAKARELNQITKNKIALEINPIQERKTKKIEEQRAINVEDLYKEFIQKEIRGRLKNKRPEYVESILSKNIVPFVGNMKIRNVKSRDIISLIEKIVERGSPVMANRTSTLVKQMFTFAESRGWIDKNPCASLTRTSIGGKEKPRETFLSYQEIWKFWHGIENTNICPQLKLGLKILLLTGQRRGELILGKWDSVDLDKLRWTIPASLSKNGKEHLVQISPLANQLFIELKNIKHNDYIVPSTQSDSDQPISERAINRAVARFRSELNLPNLTPHVLRHTFSTHLSGLKIAPHIIEKLLNHQLGGMLAVYNHHNYYAERKEALNIWSDLIARIVSSKTYEEVMEEPDLFL